MEHTERVPSSDVIRVAGGRPLAGEVTIAGAKNSVLKLMAASVLAPGRYELTNVPDISDVDTMGNLLRSFGAAVARPEPSRLIIDTPDQVDPVAPFDEAEAIRASIVVLGPLLARCGRARVPLPGGDNFGTPPGRHAPAWTECARRRHRVG